MIYQGPPPVPPFVPPPRFRSGAGGSDGGGCGALIALVLLGALVAFIFGGCQ